MERMNIQPGDTFTNDEGNSCRVLDIHAALVTVAETLEQTNEDGYTEQIGEKETTYTFSEMRRMLQCRSLYSGDRFLR